MPSPISTLFTKTCIRARHRLRPNDFDVDQFFADSIVIDGDVNYFSSITQIGQPNFETDENGLSVKQSTGINIGTIALSTTQLFEQESKRFEICCYTGARLIRTFRDMTDALANQQYGTLIYTHTHPPLGGSVDNLQDWYDDGVRIFQLTVPGRHESVDEKLGGNDDETLGLTPLGNQVVHELIRLGMIIDVSHGNEATTLDAAAIAKARSVPIIANHAPAFALRRNGDDRFSRGKTDAELLAIADTGGVVGVLAFGPWLQRTTDPATVDDFVAHLDYMVNLIGIDHVGFSSDARIDGQWNADRDGNPRVSGDGLLDAPDRWKHVVVRLHDMGYSEQELQKLMGLNFMRVYQQVLIIPEPSVLWCMALGSVVLFGAGSRRR